MNRIALSMIDGVDARFVHAMCEAGLSCDDFFGLSDSELATIDGCRRICREQINMALQRAAREKKFAEDHSIKTIFLTDDEYPPLLREIPDAPVMLYMLGNANLAAVPAIGMVGTRRCTSYGINFCDKFVSEFAGIFPQSSIVSGLAYGIDAAAHNAALNYGLQTIAVVAHGLDMIYPAAHRELAKSIIAKGGGIVTEYPSSTRPLQGNFLKRNRIIAGLSELTMVVESEVKGGAMSTASSAFSYAREVVAIPGRYSDISSSGCNMLIMQQKANIYTTVPDVIKLMGWKSAKNSPAPSPRKVLFPELEGESAIIYEFLRATASPQTIDHIYSGTGIPMANLMATLTEMEFDALINKLPGSRYELC